MQHLCGSAVHAYRAWMRRFRCDPRVIGSSEISVLCSTGPHLCHGHCKTHVRNRTAFRIARTALYTITNDRTGISITIAANRSSRSTAVRCDVLVTVCIARLSIGYPIETAETSRILAATDSSAVS